MAVYSNDEILRAIGKLEARMDEATLQREKVWQAVHEINEKLDDFERMRNRGWGVIAGVALASGGLSAALSKWLTH